jgi:hypothetical protein
MITITLEQIPQDHKLWPVAVAIVKRSAKRKPSAGSGYAIKDGAHVQFIEAPRIDIPLRTVLWSGGVDMALHALSMLPDHEHLVRQFAVWAVSRMPGLMASPSRQSIAVLLDKVYSGERPERSKFDGCTHKAKEALLCLKLGKYSRAVLEALPAAEHVPWYDRWSTCPRKRAVSEQIDKLDDALKIGKCLVGISQYD